MKMKNTGYIVLLLLIVMSTTLVAQSSFKVIVNTSNPMTSISKANLSSALSFLKEFFYQKI